MKKAKTRINFKSILVQICMVILVCVVVTGIFLMWMYSRNIKKEITNLSQNYINDLAMAYGATLDNEIKKADGDATYILTGDNLYLKLNGVGMEGVESSCVYVTNMDGLMLHHPDNGKVGHTADNAVVQQFVADIKAGKKVENGMYVSTTGKLREYIGVYVSTYGEFILVVSGEENDILSAITTINTKGNIALVVIVLISGFLGWFFAGKISKPILIMTSLTEELAEMDFSDKPEYDAVVKRKDEMGSMGRALVKLRRELIRTVERIREESSLLLETAGDLNVNAVQTSTTMEKLEIAMDEIAQGANSQATDTQRATENVVVMGDMVEEADRQVAELIEYAQQIRSTGMAATGILDSLTEVNSQTGSYIDVIARQTATTNESALKINEAAVMITDIAEETNLLSLNASIEAARAGEQGRGFAVVASQIQKLAEQSNESAKQIGGIIKALLDDTQKAVSIMEDVKEIMLKQSEHVEKTKEAFVEIQDGVDHSVKSMQVISEKTKEMDRARKDVIDAVQTLSAIAEENASSAQETSSSVARVTSISGELTQEAQRLKDISYAMEERMSVFKI